MSTTRQPRYDSIVSEAAQDQPVEHPYFRPQPGTAWAEVDEWRRLLPPGQPLITLANWQEAPHHRWAFQHMRELMPSHVIDGSDSPLPLAEQPQNLGDVTVDAFGKASTVDHVIDRTDTDGVLVLHRGTIVQEQYLASLTARRRHLVMSVSKSVISCVAASLVADGVLDPERRSRPTCRNWPAAATPVPGYAPCSTCALVCSSARPISTQPPTCG